MPNELPCFEKKDFFDRKLCSEPKNVRLDAGGKPSTLFPEGGLIDLSKNSQKNKKKTNNKKQYPKLLAEVSCRIDFLRSRNEKLISIFRF